MTEPAREMRVTMVSLDPRHPGGIVGVVDSWREAGLGELVELEEVHTAAMNDPLPAKVGQALRAFLRLGRSLLGRHRPDVVHLHSSTGGSLLRKLVLSWLCTLARVPYVVHMHSGALEAWVAASPLNRRAARSLFSRAAIAIVLGERWREAATALGARRVEVLRNGISAAEVAALEAARAGHEQPTSDAPPVLLFYGRWAPVKGLDRLGRVLRELGRDDYELRVFGSGDRGWLEDALRDVPGRVSIVGWLDAERKAAELTGAAALLAPSRSEGFPVALVEARAAGTPVIASEVGAVGEALAGYWPATLLDPDDDAGLGAALGLLIDGDWPEPEPHPRGAFPDALRSELAVERLVVIYREVTGRP